MKLISQTKYLNLLGSNKLLQLIKINRIQLCVSRFYLFDCLNKSRKELMICDENLNKTSISFDAIIIMASSKLYIINIFKKNSKYVHIFNKMLYVLLN